MSTKSKIPASKRVRDNQRRCRSRRAELLRSLQERVREYECNGVAIAKDMQRAACQVAQENLRLRSLLALRGISDEEVEAYLQSPESTKRPESRDTSKNRTDNNGGKVLDLEPPSHQNHTRMLLRSKFVEMNDTNHLERRSQVRTSEMAKDYNASHLATGQDHVRTSPGVETPGQQDQPTCLDKRTLPTASAPPSTNLEMSCETAANIIVDMGGNRDRDSVRVTLGCLSDSDCSIRNTTVWQVMDDVLA